MAHIAELIKINKKLQNEIDERKRVEEALQKSEEESKRLAQENAIVAEIGELITSTLNIEEIYERFAEKVGKLIPFDKITINLINQDYKTLTTAYAAGIEFEKYPIGTIYPLSGTIAEEIIQKRSSLLVQSNDREELLKKSPRFSSYIQAGFKSFLSIPLFSKDQVIGVLYIRSTKSNAYSKKDIKVGERVGNQISGAIANTQLFMERKQALEKYKTIIRTAMDGFWITDMQGRFLEINDAYCQLIGYSRDELLNMRISDVEAEEKPDETALHIQKIMERGEDRFETSHKCKDGRIINIEISVNYMEINGGHMFVFTRDTTEREQTEKALQKSEKEAKRLAQENAIVAEIGRIISSTLDIEKVYERFAEEVHKLIPFNWTSIFAINYKDNIATRVYVAGVEVSGFYIGEKIHLSESVTGEVARTRSSFLIQIKGEDDEILKKFPPLLETFKAGLRSGIAVPLISKDEVIGVLFVYSSKSEDYTERDLRLIERVGNQISGAIANAQLFTECKKVEEALHKSEEEAKRLAQENAIVAEIGRIISSTLNIEEVYEPFAEKVRKLIPFDRIVINTINLKQNTLTTAYVTGIYLPDRNKGSTNPITGTLVEEVIRTRSTKLFQAENLKKVMDNFPGLLPHFQAGLRSLTAIPLISKDKLIGIFHLQSTKVKAYTEEHLKSAERVGQQIAGAIANSQLFIEHERAEAAKTLLEEQLRQSQRIEAIGQLAGGIAHDFNNLLTIIKGYSDLSLFELKEESPLKENIKEIQKASQRAADLTHQLLAFSRRQVMEMKSLDLNELIRNLDKMLHRIIGEDIKLVLLLAENIEKIKGDPGQIEQVIMNLTVNARDAMPSGGTLTIETANLELDKVRARSHSTMPQGNYVMLSVKDTGCGMTQEVKERAFEPFFTTKEKGKGTGLGLSTVYGIVKQSGGNIFLDSKLGKSTTIEIYLPRVELDEELTKREENSPVQVQGSETILLVEDEEAVRTLARNILQSKGYKVLDAANGYDAVCIVQTIKKLIHLIVTDVVMPGMSGPEVAKHIAVLHPETKVLYMSGYTDDKIAHHGVLEEGTNYLQKPFTPEGLLQKIREILEKQENYKE